jgi:hypothetical protein
MEVNKPGFSAGFKWSFLGVAWIITALCLLQGILFFPFFPAGLFEYFRPQQASHANSNPPQGFFIILGWLPYLILTFAGMRTKSKVGYVVIYAVLCIFLVVNVSGCRAILDDLDRGLH